MKKLLAVSVLLLSSVSAFASGYPTGPHTQCAYTYLCENGTCRMTGIGGGDVDPNSIFSPMPGQISTGIEGQLVESQYGGAGSPAICLYKDSSTGHGYYYFWSKNHMGAITGTAGDGWHGSQCSGPGAGCYYTVE